MPEAHATPAREVLDYWFSERIRAHWFASTPELDREIRERFGETWQQASLSEMNDWRDGAEGCLALVIVLDQFPLNMFRGTPESFSTERQAIEVARHAIAEGFDQEIPQDRLAFLYMPLMHSERIEDQDDCVRLMSDAGLSGNLAFAQHHREIVRRFGRFPHRNDILGRDSTPEETTWLNSDGAFRG